MDLQWLVDRDKEFHLHRYRELCGHLILCNHTGLTGYAHSIRDKMTWLLNVGKISREEAGTIEIDVRAGQAQLEQVWKQHLATLGTKAPAA